MNTTDTTLHIQQFAFKLFGEIARHQPQSNIVVSPVSITLALAMAYNGAAGATRAAIAKTFEWATDRDEVNHAAAELARSLQQADPTVRLAIANSLWARAGVAFDQGFLERNQAFYQAEVATLDFTDPRAKDTINAWVSRNTEGKIASIVEQIPPAAVLYLINAIYFKGTWTKPFDQRRTRDLPFLLPNAGQKQLPMMHQSGSFQYADIGGNQIVALPYGNGTLEMLVVLPFEEVSLEVFQSQLSTQTWSMWRGQLHESEGTLLLPRFKIEYDITLNPVLQAIGMQPAFERNADFSGITTSIPVWIDEVKHKTYLEVNEEGTEAAAVTSVGFRTLGISVNDRRFRMVVDRPFFCAIHDIRSGSILFMGMIVDPQS